MKKKMDKDKGTEAVREDIIIMLDVYGRRKQEGSR